jgi:hypothetical protein
VSLDEQLREHLAHQEACGWHLDWPEALVALRAVLALHRTSVFPASSGEDRGRHYCVACTSSVDHHSLYVLTPCPTVRAVVDALGVTDDGSVYTSRAEAP